jgi:peptide/nickel transport system permease protein
VQLQSIGDSPRAQQQVARNIGGESLWWRAWLRFRRHRLAMVGVIALGLLVLATLLAARISPYDPLAIDLRQRNQAPGPSHWLGTDGNGRDMLARVLFGGRVSLSVGLISVTISTLIGIAIGSLAGYFGGVTDMLLMRLTDIFMAFPLLVVVIALVAITGPGIYSSMFAIGVLSWPSMARLVRAQFLTLRGVEFTQAARCLGIPSSRIILRHVLPNTVDTVVVAVTFALSEAILLEAALSFLGLGVQIPTPSWGNMLRDAQTISILEQMPWMWLPPGILIMLAVLAINFIGDGLRDALDPRGSTLG